MLFSPVQRINAAALEKGSVFTGLLRRVALLHPLASIHPTHIRFGSFLMCFRLVQLIAQILLVALAKWLQSIGELASIFQSLVDR